MDIMAFASKQRQLLESAVHRETLQYPVFSSFGGYQDNYTGRPTPKLNITRLRTLSEKPIPRAAINTIKREVSNLKWQVRVKQGVVKQKKHEKQIQILTNLFTYPNPDDSCRTFTEQIVEDVLVGDYGSFERDYDDNNSDHPLWLWPVDGSTIQIFLDWDGSPDKPRYSQVPWGVNTAHDPINLLDDDLAYIIYNKRTNTPFGYSAIEAAASYIDWLLYAQTFAAKSAAQSVPKKLLNLGVSISPNEVNAFRMYWKREIEGQGKYPIIGGNPDPSVLDLGPQNDEGLYLKWQEMLISIIAVSFDLNPQDLGMMFDSNRSNSVVQVTSTRSGAIVPMARLIEESYTRMIIAYLGYLDLEFVYIDLEPADPFTMSKIYTQYIESDVYTLGHVLELLGEPLTGDIRESMTRSEYLAYLGMKYPSVPGPGEPQSNGQTKGHGSSTGRPNGAVEGMSKS